MPKIEVDRESCLSCKSYFEVCFKDIYRWDETDGKPAALLMNNPIAKII